MNLEKPPQNRLRRIEVANLVLVYAIRARATALSSGSGIGTLEGEFGYGDDRIVNGSSPGGFMFDAGLSAAQHGSYHSLHVGMPDPAGSIDSLSTSAFKVGAATTTVQHILYNGTTGELPHDADGPGFGR